MSNKVKAPAQRRPADSTTAAHLLNSSHSSPAAPRKSSKHSSRHHGYNGDRDDPSGSSLHLPNGGTTTASSTNSNAPELSGVKSSLLQPRVAVALGLSRRWHPLLFACRLFSIAPSIWWGLPSALRLLAMLHLVVFGGSGLSPAAAAAAARAGLHTTAGTPDMMTFETRLRLTETVLAIIWVRLPSLTPRQTSIQTPTNTPTHTVRRIGVPFLLLHRPSHVTMVRPTLPASPRNI